MLVSAFELQLSDDHEGILDLPEDAPVGHNYAQWAGLADPVIDIAVTPNRPDALGIAGIARDLAAAGLGKLITPIPARKSGEFACPTSVTLDFAPQDRHLCPAFALRLVRGVKNGPSPDWLQRRLAAIGLRPINALVDITNFLTYDRNRPLHVFDAGKVKGGLTVRRARVGETLLALDGRDYAFGPDMVVIADENGPESIGGIMGGEHSGCDEATTDVLIESALWDPFNIARTGRDLGINSDARYRFERGVDPGFCLPGLELATDMVLQLCGGEPSAISVAGEIPVGKRAIRFPWRETQRLTGLELAKTETAEILARLGFSIADQGDAAEVISPSWRPDVHGKADIVEEIVRIAGIDSVASTPFHRPEEGVARSVLTPLQKRTSMARRALAARGMAEAITWSFMAKAEAELFGGGQAALALANPIAADLSDMRPSLLPGLVHAAQRNADRGLGDIALFEVGQVFKDDTPDGQRIVAAGIRRGLATPEAQRRHWQGSRQADIFDAKADVMALLAALGVATGGLQIVAGGPDWLHPGRSARLQFGPKSVIGAFGEIHPATLERLDVKGPLIAFELDLTLLPLPKVKATRTKPKLNLADLQPVTRDFAFVVARETPAGDMVRTAEAVDKSLIGSAVVFDVFEGKGIESGMKSVAVTVTLQPAERTLTEADIELVCQKIVGQMAKRFGAVLRS
jgi:phenylalanyl-tRNA synthetase beta chain